MISDIFKSRKERLAESDLSEFVRPITDNEREKLQQTLLEMYKELAAVCQKYDLVPFLCGGSALGAVRHQGFIPWDDDLDLAMSRADYDKLRRVFKKELSDKYILNAPNYSTVTKARFPKIIKKGTVFQEIGTVSADGLNGVFLDIFIIDNVPDHPLPRFFKGVVCNGAEFIASCVYDYENLDDLARRFHRKSGVLDYYIRMAVGRIFSIIPAANWFHAIDKVIRCKDENSRYCTMAQGRYHYFGEFLPRDTVFPPSYYDFCDIKAPLFGKVEYYLKNMYGDYMTIPPVEKREKHYVRELKL